MCIVCVFISPNIHIHGHAWLPTYMFTYMHLHIIYTYHSHNNLYPHVTVATTTPPVTVVCCGAMVITMTVMLAPTSVGQTTLGQNDMVLPTQ